MINHSFEYYPMSWKPDRKKMLRPYYQSLADLLERDISLGLLAPDTQLPSQRELADYLGINFTTVTRAFKLCEQRGLIYALTGSGTFVSPNASRSVTISKGMIPSHMIDLAFVSSYEQCNALVAEATKHIFEKRYVEELLSYKNPTGLARHKGAALEWLRRFGVAADMEDIAIVSGSHNALSIIFASLFDANDRVAVDEFTYANYIELAKLLRVKLVPVAGDRDGMLPDRLDAACKNHAMRGIFLVPSCASPTTVMMPDKRKRELAQVIQKRDLLLIEDDAHAFLTAGIIADYRQPLQALLPERTMYICSTSKSLCTGLRVAFLVAGERFRQRLWDAIFAMNVKTSSMDAEIVSSLILSGKALEIVARKKALAEEANALYYEIFDDVQPFGHPLSFFRWLPIKGRDPSRVEADLERQGIRLLPSDRFLVGSGTTEKFLRVSLSSTNSLEELRFGLTRLREYLQA